MLLFIPEFEVRVLRHLRLHVVIQVVFRRVFSWARTFLVLCRGLPPVFRFDLRELGHPVITVSCGQVVFANGLGVQIRSRARQFLLLV